MTLVRDRPTLTLYAGLGVLGFVLNGMGAILGPLQRDLDVDRSRVAFYPSLFAVALVVVGIVGGRLLEAVGHRAAALASVAGIGAGATLLTTPSPACSLAGAAVLGLGGALMAQVVPAALSRRHPTAAAAAVGEANAVSVWASVLAPLAVATAILAGAGWRTGYLVPLLPAAALMAVALLPRDALGLPAQPATGRSDESTDEAGAMPMFGRWVDVLLSVSVEFCLVFWAAGAFTEWHRSGPAAAPVLAAGFLVGMALVRTAAAPLTTGRPPHQIVLIGCVVAGTGTIAFWLLPFTAGAAAGLLVAGCGVALLYPVTLTRLLDARPHARDRAAARGALASGLAVGGAPLLLAALADAVGLRAAYAVVPALLVALSARTALEAKAASPRSG